MSTLRERLGITLQINTDIPFIEDFTDIPLNIHDESTLRYSAWREEERRAIEEHNNREYLSEREFNNFNRELSTMGNDLSASFVDLYYNNSIDNPVNNNVEVLNHHDGIREYIDTSFSEDPIIYDSSGNIDIISFNCDRERCEPYTKN